MIQGLLFDNTLNTYRLFTFESPCEAFRTKTFTIIGASIENNLVMIGEDSHDKNLPMTNIDAHVLNEFVYDDPPRGDVLFMLTNDNGLPISIESVDHLNKLSQKN